jgi:hypothetical protein
MGTTVEEQRCEICGENSKSLGVLHSYDSLHIGYAHPYCVQKKFYGQYYKAAQAPARVHWTGRFPGMVLSGALAMALMGVMIAFDNSKPAADNADSSLDVASPQRFRLLPPTPSWLWWLWASNPEQVRQLHTQLDWVEEDIAKENAENIRRRQMGDISGAIYDPEKDGRVIEIKDKLRSVCTKIYQEVAVNLTTEEKDTLHSGCAGYLPP